MLSRPPCAFAQVTSSAAIRVGSGPAGALGVGEHAAHRLGGRGSSSTGRRSTAAPSRRPRACRAAHRGSWFGLSIPSQRVIACACGDALGLRARHPERDLLGRPRVVRGHLLRRAAVRQPVGAAVADPAGDDERAVDDGGDERARRRGRRLAGRRGLARHLHRLVVRGVRRDREPPGPAVDPAGHRRCCPPAARRGRRAPRGPRRGWRRRSPRHDETPSQTTSTRRSPGSRTGARAPSRPRCGGAARRGRMTPPTQAGGRSAQWSRSLDRRRAALGAVPVGGDRPAALRAPAGGVSGRRRPAVGVVPLARRSAQRGRGAGRAAAPTAPATAAASAGSRRRPSGEARAAVLAERLARQRRLAARRAGQPARPPCPPPVPTRRAVTAASTAGPGSPSRRAHPLVAVARSARPARGRRSPGRRAAVRLRPGRRRPARPAAARVVHVVERGAQHVDPQPGQLARVERDAV